MFDRQTFEATAKADLSDEAYVTGRYTLVARNAVEASLEAERRLKAEIATCHPQHQVLAVIVDVWREKEPVT